MSFKTSPYTDRERYREVTKEYKRRYRARTGANKYRRGWTKGEDIEVLEQKISDRELGAKILRSVGAIQHRRSRLKNGLDNGK